MLLVTGLSMYYRLALVSQFSCLSFVSARGLKVHTTCQELHSLKAESHIEAALVGWHKKRRNNDLGDLPPSPPPNVFTVRATLSTREPLEGTLKPCANHSPPQNLRSVQHLSHPVSGC